MAESNQQMLDTLIQAILTHNADKSSQEKDLIEAVLRGNKAQVNTLLDENPNLAHLSMAYNHDYDRNPDEKNDRWDEPNEWQACKILHVAMLRDEFSIAEIFIDRGAVINEKVNYGHDALQIAIVHNQETMLAKFKGDVIKRGGDIQEWLNERLVEAVAQHQLKAATWLLNNGAQVKQKDFFDPLLHQAIHGGNVPLAKLLLDHGASVGDQDRSGNTPLHYAVSYDIAYASRCDIRMVEFILNKGADPFKQNNYGDCPLEAYLSTHEEVAKHFTNQMCIKALKNAAKHYQREKPELARDCQALQDELKQWPEFTWNTEEGRDLQKATFGLVAELVNGGMKQAKVFSKLNAVRQCKAVPSGFLYLFNLGTEPVKLQVNIDNFIAALNAEFEHIAQPIAEKILGFEQQHFDEDSRRVRQLYGDLIKRKDEYIAQLKQVKNIDKPAFEAFKKSCVDLIEKEQPYLAQRSGGWGQVLANVALAIAGLGLGYLIAICINKASTGKYAFFYSAEPDTTERLDKAKSDFLRIGYKSPKNP